MKVFVYVYAQSDDGKTSEMYHLQIDPNCTIRIEGNTRAAKEAPTSEGPEKTQKT